MKDLLMTTLCAVLAVGVSAPAFATSTSVMSQPQQGVKTSQGDNERGTWPNHWAKSDEHAATDALNDLETHGYSTFTNFHKKGYDFEATVTEGGKAIQVLVDPVKGAVTVES